MEIANDLREFLMTRRAKITPEQAGIIAGGRRRVSGLRREEVARLAGVSTEYYVQIERGRVSGVSDEVLHAIATALHLDDTETTHLFDLTRAAGKRAGPGRTVRQPVPDGVQALIDTMVNAPAIVQNGHLDVVAANALGRTLYAGVYERTPHPPNLARFIFLDERAEEVFPDWKKAADDAVALLHVEAARAPYSKAVTGLIGDLATRSEAFRTRWAAHDVKAHRRGTKLFRHPVVGELTLRFEGLQVASAPGLTLIGYTAEPGSPSAEALQLLSSWTASEAPGPAVPSAGSETAEGDRRAQA
ncbi:helix-turn-helix transcriptional regulator [Amycolatopsis rubida]|uniref:Helix-turn-helix domain-containing protein n=1 Tax=Amycolatopsis rubida TaxID=112413 RepID=A0A1I5TGX7_9PSEU|nr:MULTISPECIES: helix-turn-helix transcriptional regulator [Amycolatopsis]MYW97903.1 helix-turn-helix domain-containing protein [Amycolatopsis rubida]NEC62889.1 helix-turn-helix transcriptional regulator [Amycolatopsis rubida]OAP23966.1 helix-turn-helix protein [Amycolatopsis sp. M39]SFP81656.1 Helix-turn-helix domain-containing protein [Amycolatopsis rubida]